ncbi:DNA-formamidopyrimidine glycosylase [Frankia sp. CcI156]|uniref:Formamidopyrimidine-DNA glycosylase n=2 Tax=Frankia casuarinae (strain DSM 45818 / CECT 9043 / HFP020203 / CcI3) TaxID=106370 RepID=Q2J6Z0_FRACC|nr:MULTISPECIES: bifunctional DNA-formamidopyrimidine glycosylase/DNA-(apurinic or apyrimidinic site) lyase [Frankia]ABD12952.1 DNA-(apurinic or apyrimidinic site) lyase [Frankia casuarinae]OFB42891.1 DNA-formamidopyrimidine glycosylase [Frankia sp. CgIM4]OHV55708.1 DNA-formamidopyrimidine glycosylase [Frankia sp. CgIS1]ONH26686.1 DNA-formamidopyrimidine glycosylase [Frankia sp. CcI156]ORT55377.1 DNA-formamidopyrimidine glycosylase [Frankia sp. KB5]
MPELPEVEVVRRGLERGVVGRVIASVDVHHPRAVRRHLAGAADFSALLVGRRITAARRRGKYLWLVLQPPVDHAACAPVVPEEPPEEESAAVLAEMSPPALPPGHPAQGDALIAHLGMSGQLLVVPPATPDQKHLRIRFVFTDGGRELRFVDQRTFGGLAVATGEADLPAPVAHIARDPLDPAFDERLVTERMRRRRTGVKRALLDQTLVSGVGNIYADEALWAAKLHYARPTETLTRAEVGRLLGCVRTVMIAALEVGGTSFDRLYVSADGVSGLFERSLQVYGRAGRPCTRCGDAVRRDAFMNRSSFTCPTCQPHPRRARW